ncbi:MAG: DUF4998 domain-containing protein [Bacteroidales bacterium]|nr:DUF4998 domain-containing protein [Bacteroidales bacterium]
MKTTDILYKLFGFSFAIITMFYGCDGQDATYKEFIKEGEIVYAGIPDSIIMKPGRNRMLINFRITDPSVNELRAFWSNKSDSIVFSIPSGKQYAKYEIEIPNLKEGSYTFTMHTYTPSGTISMGASAVSRVYGDIYEEYLLNTPLKGAYVIEGKPSDVETNWGASDDTSLGCELIYKSVNSGVDTTIFIPTDQITYNSNVMVIKNYQTSSPITYRTLYRPEEAAVDTFFTNYSNIKVKGLAVEYSRGNWVAYGDDYDHGNSRPPKNAIDGNISTVWHMDKTTTYPHIMYVDMKEPLLISGFFFNQRLPLDGAVNQVEMQVSDDATNWVTVGEFFLQSVTTRQYVDLDEEVTARYFRMIAKSDYKGSKFTALAEIGAYHR